MNLRSLPERIYLWHLRRSITHIPRHIAIIQDGNRRYAKTKGMKTAMGHRLGAETTEKMLDWAHALNIEHITLYSFSTENFQRSSKELDALFSLFAEKLVAVCSDHRIHKYGIRVRIVGDRRLLPEDLRRCIEDAEEATATYDKFFLNIALAYGGRNEIVFGTRSILEDIKKGILTPDEISLSLIQSRLNNGLNLPPVDLIIRTGDERRTSNFLPWLANGNESAVYFCAPFWPTFRNIDLMRAIRVYDQRVKSGYLPNRRLRES